MKNPKKYLRTGVIKEYIFFRFLLPLSPFSIYFFLSNDKIVHYILQTFNSNI